MQLPLTDYDLHPRVKQRILDSIEQLKGALLSANPADVAKIAGTQERIKALNEVLGIPAIIQREAENERRKNQL